MLIQCPSRGRRVSFDESFTGEKKVAAEGYRASDSDDGQPGADTPPQANAHEYSSQAELDDMDVRIDEFFRKRRAHRRRK
jgi:hypothetical protein